MLEAVNYYDVSLCSEVIDRLNDMLNHYFGSSNHKAFREKNIKHLNSLKDFFRREYLHKHVTTEDGRICSHNMQWAFGETTDELNEPEVCCSCMDPFILLDTIFESVFKEIGDSETCPSEEIYEETLIKDLKNIATKQLLLYMAYQMRVQRQRRRT